MRKRERRARKRRRRRKPRRGKKRMTIILLKAYKQHPCAYTYITATEKERETHIGTVDLISVCV